MELFRALGALAEVPVPDLAPMASELGLGSLPQPHAHTELFGLQLVPYASIYLGEDGRVGGEARDRILGFWRVLGLTPDSEADQLTLMLASYAELCAREAAASGETGEATQEAARHHRSAFLHEHLLSWLPAYLLKVSALGPSFYRAWAALLAAALANELDGERDRSQLVRAESMHFRLSAPFPAPDATPDELLDALVAPMRSGFLLTRRDLSEAARELDIGSRMGERRYMLEAMLRQRPVALLSWLVGHCERALEVYDSEQGPLRYALAPWVERATRARRSLVAALEAE